MPATEYRYTISPRWSDLDANQHVRHSAYADWATHSRTDWLSAHGFTLKRMTEMNVAPIIFEESTKYFKEIYLGDQIVIDLQLVGLNQDASRYHMRQAFRRDDTICALYEIKGAWIDIANRRIAPPPPLLLDATENMVRSEDYAEITSKRK
jgi:acyl-CoA thioester hydrolase